MMSKDLSMCQHVKLVVGLFPIIWNSDHSGSAAVSNRRKLHSLSGCTARAQSMFGFLEEESWTHQLDAWSMVNQCLVWRRKKAGLTSWMHGPWPISAWFEGKRKLDSPTGCMVHSQSVLGWKGEESWTHKLDGWSVAYQCLVWGAKKAGLTLWRHGPWPISAWFEGRR